MKKYVPIGNLERQTSICPVYLAWQVLDEARNYLRAGIPDAYATELAARAEDVFAAHPCSHRKFKSNAGREQLLASMRHWLAGVLARERAALFRQLPDGFLMGEPLPVTPHKNHPSRVGNSRRFHGCALLAM